MKKTLFGFLLLVSPLLSRAADGDSIWAANFIHDIYFNFTQANYWDTLLDTHTTGNYMSCTMIFDGRTMDSVAIKTKGNSSFNNNSIKKSLKIDLNEFVSGQDYDGIKKFNLNNGFKDPTMLREKIMLDYLNNHGMVASRCTYARVYLNNVYWGLYTLVEEVSSSKFLKQRYPDNDGNLFKGDPQGDMKWYGATQSSYYTHYSLETNSTANDWSDLVNFLDVVNNSPTTGYFDSVSTVMEPWSFCYYLAAVNIFADLDSYIGSGHNYFVYDDSTSLKFHMIPWDVNEGFGNFNMNMTVSQIENLSYDYLSNPAGKPMAQKLFADPTLHAMYISAYCDLMQDFSNTYLDPYIDSLYNAIKADAYADPNKFFPNAQFDSNISTDQGNIPGLKPFITARRASLTSQLSAYGCWLTTEEAATTVKELLVFPNPAANSATILLPSAWSSNELFVEIYDASGRAAEVPWTHTDDQLRLDLSSLANGIYFAEITNADGTVARSKIIVQR